VVIENCAVATMDGRQHDDTGAEHRSGHIVMSGGRITAVGEGPAPAGAAAGARRVDGTGCLATPGLINTHHHLYQWLTQGRAQQSVLFDWLTELYPVWARIDPAQVRAAATAGLGWLALSGCTTSTDHHYIFPPAERGALEAEITAAAGVGGGAGLRTARTARAAPGRRHARGRARRAAHHRHDRRDARGPGRAAPAGAHHGEVMLTQKATKIMPCG
jgi:cytosine/adenosine deaminase-related metal-dependent hydrolase